MRGVAINLVSGGVSCVVRANPGVQAAYNILDAPQKYRQTAFLIIRKDDIKERKA